MRRQALLATALVLSLMACTAEAEPFDEQISNDVTISDVTVTAVEDGAGGGQRAYALDYTLHNDTGERIGITLWRVFTLLPDAHDPQTLVVLDDFPPEEEDNTSYAPPEFDIDVLEPDVTLSRRFGDIGVDPQDPLFDLPYMRVCAAFFRESSRFIGPLHGITIISQALPHNAREVACSPAIPMPAAFSD